MRSATFLFTVIFLFSLCLMAAGQEAVLPLYEGPAPGSESWNWAEISQPSTDGLARVANVTKPTLTVYPPEPGRRNGMGVVVAPGGGFQHLAIEHEGSEVAEWLRAQGVTVFVLKYRLMRTAGAPSAGREELNRRRREAIVFAVADGLQAMRIARKNAARFGVDPHRLGILGFSAGGWVTVAAALDGREDSRPDFAAPIYAAMPENLTPPPAPMPLFLAHANDDKVVDPLKTSVRLYQVWKQTGASAELHIYAHGGHGFGMRKKGLPTDSWLERFWEWAQAEQFAGSR
ncbi:MAG: alpha/beta hydrolase [Bryobacterales bacterium]|nr:alpha/beta hydrolase [Bryobacterales bacterium]